MIVNDHLVPLGHTSSPLSSGYGHWIGQIEMEFEYGQPVQGSNNNGGGVNVEGTAWQ